MRHLTITIPHQLSRAEAKRRITAKAAELQHQRDGMLADLQTTWAQDDMTFSVKTLGQSISGKLRVDDQAVQVTLDLPWLLGVMSGPIQRQIEDGLHQTLRLSSETSTK